MKSFGSFCSGPKYGSSCRRARAEEQHQLAASNLPACARRRRSVIARIGALPVPVQIITMCDVGWFGIRKVVPNGPITSHLVADLAGRTGSSSDAAHRPPWWSSVTRFTVSETLL